MYVIHVCDEMQSILHQQWDVGLCMNRSMNMIYIYNTYIHIAGDIAQRSLGY